MNERLITKKPNLVDHIYSIALDMQTSLVMAGTMSQLLLVSSYFPFLSRSPCPVRWNKADFEISQNWVGIPALPVKVVKVVNLGKLPCDESHYLVGSLLLLRPSQQSNRCVSKTLWSENLKIQKQFFSFPHACVLFWLQWHNWGWGGGLLNDMLLP